MSLCPLLGRKNDRQTQAASRCQIIGGGGGGGAARAPPGAPDPPARRTDPHVLSFAEKQTFFASLSPRAEGAPSARSSASKARPFQG